MVITMLSQLAKILDPTSCSRNCWDECKVGIVYQDKYEYIQVDAEKGLGFENTTSIL